MRVLVIDPAGQLWGSERALLDMLDAPSTLNWAVCLPPKTPLVAELEKRSIRIFPYFVLNLHLKKSFLWKFVAAVGVFIAVLRYQPTVIHLNQSGAYRISRLASSTLRIPIVSHVRIYEDAKYLSNRVHCDRHLAAMIAISNSVVAELQLHKELRKYKIFTIYDAYRPGLKMYPVKAEKCLRIGCVGRVTPIKGQDVLMAALKLLDDEGKRIECMMLGDGEIKFLEEQKHQSSAFKSVQVLWKGKIHDVLHQLRTCSVMICPSHLEPLGRVIFESWDAGVLPIVFEGSGGAAEIITDSNGGILYSEQSAECLSEVISAVLSMDIEEIRKYVRNGQEWMKSNNTPELYIKKITAVYGQVT